MNSRKFVAGGAAFAMALSLVGCSGGGDSSNSAKETLKVGTTQELAGIFNPMYASTAYDQWVVNMVYQSMIAYNADSELYPVLAEELPEVSEDGMTITYKLKEGQKFSDGSTLDGDDVKYTFTLMADPEYIGGYNDGAVNFIEGWDEYQNGDAEDVSGITVSDDKLTVTFKCGTPDIDAANTIGGIPIMPSDQFEYTKGDLDKYKNMAPTEIIGSGPYKLNKYDKSAGASVVLNENYTGEGTYNIKSVIVRTIGVGTEVASLQAGDIDYLPEEINTDIIGPASTVDTLTTDHYFRAAEGYFGFNCQGDPTSDVKVRQALAYATPREEFRDTYYKWPEKDGKAQVADDIADVSVGYVPATFWSPVGAGLGEYVTGDASLEGLQTYGYDIDKAKSLLDEAGWKEGADGVREKDGKKLQIKMLCAEGNSVLDILVPLINKSWKEIGVDLVQNTVDFNTMITTIDPTNEDASSDWNVFFMALTFTGLSNTSMNQALGFSGSIDKPVPGGNNYPQIYNQELNDLLNAGKETGDEEVSIDNYKKAMVMASELCPFLGIYGNNLFNIYNKRVKDLKTGPVCNWSQALDGASLDLEAAIKSSQEPVVEAASEEGDDSAASSEAASSEAASSEASSDAD